MAGNFSTWLNTATLPEFSDLVKKQFVFANQSVEPKAKQLFIYEDLLGSSQASKRYDEIDTETFAKLKREGENAQKARAGVGYNKTMYAKRVAMEIDVSWEFRRYGNEHQVKSDLKSLNGFVESRIDLDLTHVLTFCTSTSYTDMDGETVDVTVGDGLALASTVHTLAFSSTTYSNRVSGDPAFSQGALEAAETLAESEILSSFGDKRTMMFNTIITTTDPTTCRQVKQLLNSTADVDGAQSGLLNAHKGQYSHIALPYLATTALGAKDTTKKRWWFLAALGQGVMGWQAYFGMFEMPNLKTPSAGSNLEDGHNDNWSFGTRGSYGKCVVSPKGLIASCPTS